MARAAKREVTKIMELIEDDKRWRDFSTNIDAWRRYEEHSEGKFQTAAPHNLYFSTVNLMATSTYFRNPGVIVQSNMPTGGVRAKIVEKLDKWLLEALNVAGEVNQSARDCFHCGIGFIVMGYDSEFGPPIADQKNTLTNKGGTRLLEYTENVRPGMPWALRAHPTDILLPYGATRLTNLSRFTLRKWRRLDDVKADSKYSAAATKGLSATRMISGDSYVNSMPHSSEEWVLLYEMHDLTTGMVYVVGEGGGKFLRREKDVLSESMGQLPLVPVCWNPGARTAWGTPDGRILEPSQLEANILSLIISKHRRVNLPKFMYNTDVITEDDFNKWLSGENVQIGIPVDGDFEKALKEIKSSYEGGLALDLERIVSSARQQLGINENMQGSYSPPTKRVTSQEVKATQSGASIPASARRAAVANSLKQVIQGLNSLIFRFWDEHMFVYAPDVHPDFDFIVFKGTDLAAPYSYEINPEEQAPPNTQALKQEALMLAPALLKLAEAGVAVDPNAVIRQALAPFEGYAANEMLQPGAGSRPPLNRIGILDPSGTLRPLPGRA